jgi:HEAT repeat protein
MNDPSAYVRAGAVTGWSRLQPELAGLALLKALQPEEHVVLRLGALQAAAGHPDEEVASRCMELGLADPELYVRISAVMALLARPLPQLHAQLAMLASSNDTHLAPLAQRALFVKASNMSEERSL